VAAAATARRWAEDAANGQPQTPQAGIPHFLVLVAGLAAAAVTAAAAAAATTAAADAVAQ